MVIPGSATERAERIGDRDGDLGAAQIADRLIDVSNKPDHALAGGSEVLDGIGDEWQRAAAEGVADEFWCQVEDAVPEAGAGCGGAVVRLVGMQDVQLPGQADTARTAVPECLHPG